MITPTANQPKQGYIKIKNASKVATVPSINKKDSFLTAGVLVMISRIYMTACVAESEGGRGRK